MLNQKKLIGFAIIAIIAIVLLFYIRPMKYLAEEQIQKSLLKQTPMGCDKSLALKYVENKNFKIISQANGAYNMGNHSSNPIGNSFIQVTIGEYWFLFSCSVEAVWVFDSNNKLMHLDVWKEWDAP